MFNFVELDGFTRKYMRLEYMMDKERGVLYTSRVMSEEGLAEFPTILLDALNAGTVESFAAELDNSTYWGPKARNDAHASLAEEQFNQYYMRGLLAKLTEEGQTAAEIYLAQGDPRARRRGAQPGEVVNCADALEDLRDPQRAQFRGKTGLVRGSKTGISLKRVGQKVRVV